MTGLFVAGTDTGVGKTFVASAVCRALRERGALVAGLKPFETGCDPVARDAAALERAAQSGLPIDLRCPFRFRLPLAPAAAAEREGRRTGGSVARAATLVRRIGEAMPVVVESAGGIQVPLEPRRTNLDLAAELGLPVLLVGRNSLGTINHTVLTLDALERRGLRLWAVVLSAARRSDPSGEDNARWIAAARRGRRPRIVVLPRSTRAEASRRLGRELALDRLVG